MIVGVPREHAPGETRAAASPESVAKFIERGATVLVEAGLGGRAALPDKLYKAAGAELVEDPDEIWKRADLILKIGPPVERPDGTHEADLLTADKTFISFIWPGQDEELVERLRATEATTFAMDKVPRITRAQKMDALSSMANIAGYRAVVEAATVFGSFFSGQITAAGRTKPAHVMVIGAGVAGLAAIAAAKGLGGVVHAFDTREAVREQVQSLGAKFLELDFEESGEGAGGYAKVMSKEFIEAEMALFREQAPKTDIIITTALIPGKPAPKLILADMVELMPPGGVVVDLAAEQGGNCELTEPGEIVVKHDVTLIGLTNLPARLPTLASRLYATNIFNLVTEIYDADNQANVDLDNEVIRGAIITNRGEVLWPPPKKVSPPPEKKPEPAKVEDSEPDVVKPAESAPSKSSTADDAGPTDREESTKSPVTSAIVIVVCGAVLALMGVYAPTDFLQHFTVFLLACIVGWHVVWNVTAALHTPLMSVTNAISGIILIGGMLLVRGGDLTAASICGVVAVLVASINAAGGFLVTHRMLKMFRK